jgi:PKD repeat protein
MKNSIHRKVNLLLLFILSLVFIPHLAQAIPGFIENKGQWPEQVLFAADIPGGKLYVERTRLLYAFVESPLSQHNHSSENTTGKDVSEYHNDFLQAHAFEVKFLHANTTVRAQGVGVLDTRYNYISGSDQSGWQQQARAYETIIINDLYTGVDLKLYTSGSSVKYDLLVKPGGHLNKIELAYSGLDSLQLKEKNLHMKTSLGEIIEMKPYVYQEHNGKRTDIPCKFNLKSNRVTFDLEHRHDPSATLVIDPLIIFSAYSGSATDNWGNTATYDDAGNAYMAGIVYGTGYPTKTGAYQVSFRGGTWDIGIMKFDSAGTKMLYATYLGGGAAETPQSLVVNHAGELLILGTTSSLNFPVTNGSSFGGGTDFTPMDGVHYVNGSDLFVAKLSSDGTKLLGSTYIGGSGNDGVNFVSGSFDTQNMVQSALGKNYGDQFRGDIITDSDDNVYIASNTRSSDIANAVAGYAGGTHDAVVVKLTADLSEITWSRCLGGSATDAAYSLKLDSSNTIFVAGGTTSTNFAGINGYKKTKGSDIDGWVAQLSNDGQQIINATYLGTSSYDQVYFVDINNDQNVYVYGQTQGTYPVSSGVFSQSGGGQFIHKLSHDLQSSVFSTVFGSGNYSPNISPTAFLVNDCNKIYIAGWGGVLNTTTIRYRNQLGQVITVTRNFVGGSTTGLRVSADAYQSRTSGSDFYLMVLDEDASAFLYGTFLGGTQSATHVDGGTSRFDKRGIVYHAVCAGCGGYSDFPAVNAPAGHATNASRTQSQCNNAIFKFDLATLRAVLQTNSVALDDPGIDTLCYPSSIVFQNFSSGAKYYVWNMGDGTEITKQDTSAIVYTYTTPGVYNVTLTAYNAETCEGQDIATVTVSVFDPEIEVSDDGSICKGSSYQLYATGGVKYQWTNDSTFTSSLPNPKVTPTDTTIYYVAIQDEVGCEVSDTVAVNVIPGPEYKISMEKHYDCWNRPVVRFSYTTKDSYTYTWNLGDGTTSTEKDFAHNYPADGGYTVTFKSTNDYCSYNENISLNVVTIKVPNVITANSDERNDVLQIQAPDQVDLKIYNLWGRLIFHDEDYHNTWSATGLSTGVYYYKIDVQNEASCKGWVHVIK